MGVNLDVGREVLQDGEMVVLVTACSQYELEWRLGGGVIFLQ